MQPVQQTPQYWLDPGPDLPARTWQRRTRKPIIVISSIAATVLAVIALGALVLGVQERDFTADGSVVLTDQQYEVSATDICGGIGEFEDVRQGTRVRVLDEDLSILGQSELSAPELSDNRCVLPFSISGIPEGRADYVVEVGTTLRYEASESKLAGGITIEP
ncbi:MAG: hypothetical protein C0482_09255 [Gordonia sp.]|uniref:hypothetical protein n=1 Tax=Williamsia sp. 1138 TaxID=1903117 RepID=UPI000A11CD69|nr:hypothetical protein [Williamsia sp. 1138]MBA4022540.1 hypothetical protein [Gordonia sp. (in: high G+C Gram-positive bacteria)]OZG28270.1 hypothetical protein BH683_014640 [Williamsia sp. 1138]